MKIKFYLEWKVEEENKIRFNLLYIYIKYYLIYLFFNLLSNYYIISLFFKKKKNLYNFFKFLK